MKFESKYAVLAGVIALAAVGELKAQGFDQALGSLTYPGCTEVKKADFTSVRVLDKAKAPDLFEPTRFAFTKSGRIFVAERNGTVRIVETNGSVAKAGSVSIFPTTTPIPGNNELGLVGLALDPGFETNGFIYLMYQPPTPAVTKISRFKINGQTMDAASEQVLITMPNQRAFCCHTGGGMEFDNKGDLWISSGNNTANSSAANGYVDESNPDKDDQAHAANTNDYRGKILRIHPTATAGANGKFYTIPAGNLREYYSSLWTPAQQDSVLPELYTMGHRSNYTISVDTLKGWLAWGDIGPDEGRQTEELNLVTKPGFYGWPYFAGSKRTGTDPYQYKASLPKDEAAPMNLSKNNTGVAKLPPAIPATFGYRQAAAITGPIYRWNAAQTGAKKLPAHFDGKWIIGDFNVGQIQVATVDANANMTGRVSLFNGLIRPLAIKVGPDGYLYTLEYANSYFATDGSTAIKRWEYNGAACTPVVGVRQAMATPKAAKAMMVNVGFKRTVTMPAGAASVNLYDMQGRLAWTSAESAVNSEAMELEIPAALPVGLYRAVIR